VGQAKRSAFATEPFVKLDVLGIRKRGIGLRWADTSADQFAIRRRPRYRKRLLTARTGESGPSAPSPPRAAQAHVNRPSSGLRPIPPVVDVGRSTDRDLKINAFGKRAGNRTRGHLGNSVRFHPGNPSFRKHGAPEASP
jgi:hypothetical protein